MAESFEEFLEHWRKQSLPTASGRELDALLDQRGRELSEAAIARGFRSQLTNACKPYRTMSEFVRASTTPHIIVGNTMAKMDRKLVASE